MLIHAIYTSPMTSHPILLLPHSFAESHVFVETFGVPQGSRVDCADRCTIDHFTDGDLDAFPGECDGDVGHLKDLRGDMTS